MSTPLEQYALLSDMRTGPLVSRDGSIDWLCLPRFDSPAVFSAILGDADDGSWRLAVVDGQVVERRYLPQTFVLETTWSSPTGKARVTEFLPPSDTQGDLVRRVECLEGEVQVEHDLRLRFDYGRASPWIRQVEGADGETALLALAGPDGILVTGPTLSWANGGGGDGDGRDGGGGRASGGGRAQRLVGTFPLVAGETLDWDLTWFPSYAEPPEPPDADRALAATVEFWADWATTRCSPDGGSHCLASGWGTRSLLSPSWPPWSLRSRSRARVPRTGLVTTSVTPIRARWPATSSARRSRWPHRPWACWPPSWACWASSTLPRPGQRSRRVPWEKRSRSSVLPSRSPPSRRWRTDTPRRRSVRSRRTCASARSTSSCTGWCVTSGGACRAPGVSTRAWRCADRSPGRRGSSAGSPSQLVSLRRGSVPR